MSPDNNRRRNDTVGDNEGDFTDNSTDKLAQYLDILKLQALGGVRADSDEDSDEHSTGEPNRAKYNPNAQAAKSSLMNPPKEVRSG